MPLPIVAIVGAPNVGKSTLFNRLLGRRRAIVSDQPGVTRDRLMATCNLSGVDVVLVDTGGMVEDSGDDLVRQVRSEAVRAVREADLLLHVIDARNGVTPLDMDVARLLRKSGKPVVAVANKIDAATLEGMAADAYRLGLGEVVPISAEQDRGIDDLLEWISRSVPAHAVKPPPAGVPVAIVGRPNVGKSSLFNRLLRESRSLVTPIPGTTRDPIDAQVDLRGTVYRIVDTAGIRRRAGRGEEVERVSVLKARQALSEASIAIGVVDASVEIGHQDLALLGLIAERRMSAVIAANKIDLVAPRGQERRRHLEAIRTALAFAPRVPIVGVSALTGEGFEPLTETLGKLHAESQRRFATAELNRVLQEVVREKQPPSDGGHEVRFYYMTQSGGTPPRFIVFGNGRRISETYRRFMEGRMRSRLGLELSPVLLTFRRSRPVR